MNARDYLVFLRRNTIHTHISFAECDLRAAQYMNGLYIGCDFRRADLRGLPLHGRFVDCDFRGARLDDATLDGTFVGCRGLPQEARS